LSKIQSLPHWAGASDGTRDVDTMLRPSVLETFQTYHAIFGTVNRGPGWDRRRSTESCSKHWTYSSGAHTACRSRWFDSVSKAHKAPERLSSLKILYWRFCAYANLPRSFVLGFQPRGRGSFIRAPILDAGFSRGMQISSRVRRRQYSPSLTNSFISDQDGACNPVT